MSLKIPTKVKVGGVIYKVKIQEDWLGRDGADGMVDDKFNQIYVCSKLSHEFQEITFIHEILHCMNSTINHEFLDSLSEQLYALLRDNKLI